MILYCSHLSHHMVLSSCVIIKTVSQFCLNQKPQVPLHSRHLMSEGVLSPSFETASSLIETIQKEVAKKGDQVELANLVSSLLIPINQWSNQIPQMLSGPTPFKSANLIFSIRKELFPAKDTNVFGKALADLPQTIQFFDSFVHKLMDAQEKAKKPVPKVRL
jgi:hypothetical protein